MKGEVETRRGKVYGKTDGHCAYCGLPLYPFGPWHTEHMTPKAQGGETALSNLVASCARCNQMKKKKDVEDFRLRLTVGYADEIQRMGKDLQRFMNQNQGLAAICNDLEKASQSLRSYPLRFYMDIPRITSGEAG